MGAARSPVCLLLAVVDIRAMRYDALVMLDVI